MSESGHQSGSVSGLAAASLAVMAALLAACGGGGGGGSTPAPQPAAPYAWTDANSIQAFGAATQVVMGFDGSASYLRQDSHTHTQAGSFKPDLSYIGDSGTPQVGQTTQWVRFALRGDRWFETQGAHLPIILRFAQYPDPQTAQQAPRSVEGQMVFFGRDGLGAWGCATPAAVGIYFETRIAGRTEVPDLGAVKCAQNDPGLRDGVWYRIEISAGPHEIAYTVADEAGRLIASGRTDDRDYPASDWNRAYLAEVVNAQPCSAWAARRAALDGNRSFAFLNAFGTASNPWTLSFADISSGWR